MAILQVKRLPDDVHARLVARSRAQGLTMAEYVTRLLTDDLMRPSMDEWLAAHPATPSDAVIDVSHALREVRVEYAADRPEPVTTR